MDSFRTMISGSEIVIAPGAFNGMMAKLAEAAGFRALYLSGGSLGWLKGVTEATLTLPEMAEVAVEIRTVCDLPIILDAAGGWGDPVHIHRTIRMAEAAGFSAIEIEDQILPKRVSHHVGVDQIVPTELMVAKIKEAVAARTNPEFVIIARTDALRPGGLDEALRRAEAYHRAGADALFVAYALEEKILRTLGERLPRPLMTFTPLASMSDAAIPLPEMARLGFRIMAAPLLPIISMHKALQQCYTSFAQGGYDPLIGKDAFQEVDKVQATVGLPRLLEIEQRTMGR